MKIKELEKELVLYGDIKISELIKNKKGLFIYECPGCKGEGVCLEKYNAYPSNLPDSGFVEDIRTREIKCEICNGFGYTKEELIPIQETKTVGYKRK